VYVPQGSAGGGPGGAGYLPGAGLYPGITNDSHDLLTTSPSVPYNLLKITSDHGH